MPPACLERDQPGFLKRLLPGRPQRGALAGWQLWMCGWTEEVSLAEGSLVPRGRRGPSWVRKDVGGGKHLADSKR